MTRSEGGGDESITGESSGLAAVRGAALPLNMHCFNFFLFEPQMLHQIEGP